MQRIMETESQFEILAMFRLNQGRIKLCRLNKSVIVFVDFLEFFLGGISHDRLFPTDQTISVEIDSEKVFHSRAFNHFPVKLLVSF